MPERKLRVDWCSYEAAKYAVMRWHYSKTMPASSNARLGIWHGSEFKGVIIFATGANKNMHKPYGLQPGEVCELVRVALRSHHEFPVTQAVARSLKKIKARYPRLKLIVSYADTRQGHLGIIYQAGNWIYTGMSAANTKALMVGGKRAHKRAFTGANFGAPALRIPEGAKWVPVPPKHRYVMPLDKCTRRLVRKLSKPYPKRADANPGGPRLPVGERRCEPDPSAPRGAQPDKAAPPAHPGAL